jgi:hypothetical protein
MAKEDSPVLPYGDPSVSEFRSFTKRFKSFSEWPARLAFKVEEMARAGFFFTGRGCFLRK